MLLALRVWREPSILLALGVWRVLLALGVWRTGLGDAQGGDVDELLEAKLAAALDTDAGLLDATCRQRYRCHLEKNATQTPAISWRLTEGGAGAAAGVGVDAAHAGLDAGSELRALLEVVRPDLRDITTTFVRSSEHERSR